MENYKKAFRNVTVRTSAHYSRFVSVVSGKEVSSAYHSTKCAGISSDKEEDHKLNEEVNRVWSTG